MKICEITSVHRRYDSRIFQKICVSLANAGHETYLLCMDNLAPERKNGVNIVSVNFAPKNRIDRILHSSKCLYKKAKEIDADIYHLHDPELLKLGLKLQKLGKKIIFDSHEDTPSQIMAKEYIPNAFKPMVMKLYTKIQNKALKKYDGVIAATDFIAKKLGRINKNTVAINNYPVLDAFCDIDHSSNTFDKICYVGGINAYRGVDKLVAIAKNKSYNLIIAGETDKGILDMIGYDESMTNISLRGYVGLSEVKEIYEQSSIGMCTLLATPNHINSNPIKIFEYMSAGLAVICSDFPKWKEIVEENDCGICVDPNNIEQISSAIDGLLGNPKKIIELGQNGRRAAINKYNWQIEEQKLIDFVNEL